MRTGLPPGSLARLAAIFATAAICAGCERPSPPVRDGIVFDSPGVTVRDSAGVRIVENHSPESDPGSFWTLDPEPVVAIGGIDSRRGTPETAGDSSAHLIWKVTGLSQLPDGRVAVLSGANKMLLVYERSGRLARTIGREGEGPGEFWEPVHLQLVGEDTLAVWDYMFGHVTYFDTVGVILSERRIDLGAVFAAAQVDGASPPENVHLPLADGSFLLALGRRSDTGRPGPGRLFRPPVKYVRIDHEYAAHSFGWWDGAEQLDVRFPVYPLPLFGARSEVAGGGNPLSVYITNGDRNEIHEFSATGVLQRIVRRTADPVPITREEREAALGVVVERNPPMDFRAWEEVMDALPRRDHHPFANRLLVPAEPLLNEGRDRRVAP
ncbi:MAG: 6-bladed beta-propeller [Gemmatimonadetes bacterium]|nr:6-bladed beta-propeller [Gemmatimonadota bacterium]